MTIRVLLCDDQALITEGLQMILETDREFKVIGAARDGIQVLEMAAELKPDIVLMDLKMPGMNGVHATRAIRRDFPDLPVLVLTTFDADDWVMDAIRAGASGYLLKDTPRDQLIHAIKDTVAGKTYIDPNIAGKLLGRLANAQTESEPSTLSAQLNEREIELLTLMTHGLNYGEIAKRMFLSEGTVRNYASAMFAKMNVSDRMQAVTLAMRFGLTNSR
jgi:two-component system, NarL family, response regulator LiaR